jgi:hypothetical protein
MLAEIERCSGPIEKIEVHRLGPRRIKGPKTAWLKTWPKTVIIDCKDKDQDDIFNDGFNQIL